MNYTEAMAYLDSASRRGIVPGLDSIRNLLRYLGDPQKQLRFVHIAGTNGKGSTTAMISSVCAAAGYITGRYTSPAVFDDREKYAVNGEWITESEYAQCMDTVADAVIRMESDQLALPTSFEIETALAMLHFLRRGCDIVVLETGMGGMLDATNVVDTTVACVLTAIGMDHTRFLGNTIDAIAMQKAGIIKPGCRVILEKQSEPVHTAIADMCKKQNASLTVTSPEQMVLLSDTPSSRHLRYRNIEFNLPLPGSFQLDNSAAVIDCALQLREIGLFIDDDAIARGIAQVSWPGRLQKIHTRPDIYLDGAHNPNAAVRLAESLPSLLNGRRLICIMGVLADKDFSHVAELICAQADAVITLTPDNARALDAAELAKAVAPYCKTVEIADNARNALSKAMDLSGADDVILAFGSLSYLKQITAAIKDVER